ncbi:MAG: barstar family protein [Christensenellales bacterium]
MRLIELDGRDMDSRAQLHRVLKASFGFPDFYGRNLDALNDCLGEISQVEVRLSHPQALLNSLGAYGQRVLDLLREIAATRSDFHFTLVDE